MLPTPHTPSAAQLTLSAEKLFYDIASCAPSSSLLTHFSQPYRDAEGTSGTAGTPSTAGMAGTVVLEHSFSTCASPGTYRFTGLHAVRSYFDLLKTHYEAKREWRVVDATAAAASGGGAGSGNAGSGSGARNASASAGSNAGFGAGGASASAGGGAGGGGKVTLLGTTRWTWRTSRQSWTEHWTAYLEFDGAAKVRSFVVITTSGEETCVMRAVDPGRGVGAEVGLGAGKKKLFDV